MSPRGARERLWWNAPASWSDRLLLSALAPGEGLFRAVALARGALYGSGILPATRAEVPVVSVGNLSVGGAGKTPVVLALAERLLAAGRRPAVLSRGYGASRTDERVVSDGSGVLLDAAQGGDEPVLLARRLPGLRVLCGPDRAALAGRSIALGADLLLLDDGFQHRRLLRDLDVVVLDAANPWGNGHCLPRGPNREPPSALGRAGLVWLGHADRAPLQALESLRDLARRHTGREPVESRHAPRDLADGRLERRFPLEEIAGRPVGLLTGVARPGSVRRTVEGLGARVVHESAFPDHHRFTESDVDGALDAASRAGAALLVTTEKDAVRLPPSSARDERLRALRIDVQILAGEAELRSCLDGLLHGRGR